MTSKSLKVKMSRWESPSRKTYNCKYHLDKYYAYQYFRAILVVLITILAANTDEPGMKAIFYWAKIHLPHTFLFTHILH